MRVIRRSALVLAAVAALAVPAGVASAAPAKPATPAAQLLLTQGDFPAGYKVEKLSQSELTELTSGLGDVFASAKATPAHCLPVVTRGALAEAAGLPMVVAVNEAKRTAVSEVITSKSADAAVGVTPGCEKVRMETAVGANGRIVMDVTTTPVTLPGAPAGAKTVLVRSTGTATVDGETQPIRQEQIMGAQDVRGYGVLVVGNAVGDNGATVDRAGYARILTAATDKVRTAK